MRKRSILSLLILTAAVSSFGLNQAQAGFPVPPGFPPPPQVNVRISGFLPPPPGVYIQMDAGRPYYVERDRRVYIERERPAKHHKKYKKHHEDRGRGHGHGRD
ncbi:MAG: hypothetical protein M0T70_00985 [Geobacteraceae bacterium]|nr:hypothetical protein [Geobacteraceae bacterium]